MGLPLARVEADEQYTGGTAATTFDFGENAFGVQAKFMTAEQNGFFVTGNSFFRSSWITAPGSVQTLDGLGPLFNDISCGSCHFKDGRAQPPAGPGEPLRGLLFRLSVPGMDAHGGSLPEPVYGGQLQDKSILGVKNEGLVWVSYEEENGVFGDGTTFTLRKPVYEFRDLNYGTMSPDFQFSPRIAQQIPGLGLLEIVPESDILTYADEFDSNSDGISGKPNYVWDVEKQQTVLGRFGWKANQPSLRQQAAGAFNGDIGISSSLFPEDNFSQIQRMEYPNIPDGGSPEIPDESLRKVVSYLQSLSVPARRDHEDQQVLRGKYLFNEIKCSACHRPQLNTGNGGEISSLQNQKIWPYTDLLLHDMGAELSDGRPDFLATGNEWRTPPLWGIGLVPVVNGHSYLLHDGRARNVEEAILWHRGEALEPKENFRKLDLADREALVKFVESL